MWPAKRTRTPATGRPLELALKATQARVPAWARVGESDSLSGRRLGGGAETTVEVMPVPQPLLDGVLLPPPL